MHPAEPSRSSRTNEDTAEDAPASVQTVGSSRPGFHTCTVGVVEGLEYEIETPHFLDASASDIEHATGQIANMQVHSKPEGMNSSLLPREVKKPPPITRNGSAHPPLHSIVVGPAELLHFRLQVRRPQMQGPIFCKLHNGLEGKVRPAVIYSDVILLLKISWRSSCRCRCQRRLTKR